MKKFLSLILSALLLVSVTPVALAGECEHSFDAATADRDMCTFICADCGQTVEYQLADYSQADLVFTYDPELNLYTTEEYALQAAEDFQAVAESLYDRYPVNLSSYEQAQADAYARWAQAECREFSRSVSSGKYGMAVDAALLLLVMARYDSFVDTHEPLEDYFSDETLHKIKVIQREDFYYLTVIYQELSMDTAAITSERLAEFGQRLERADGMVSSMYACTAGEHSYDGQGVCSFCGEIRQAEICEYCHREHLTRVDEYICILVRLIEMLVDMLTSIIK